MVMIIHSKMGELMNLFKGIKNEIILFAAGIYFTLYKITSDLCLLKSFIFVFLPQAEK